MHGGMRIRYEPEIPQLVTAAKRLAATLGFDLRPHGNVAGNHAPGPSACLDEVGSLLMVLAATRQGGRMGEAGTGAGVGTAWMASGLRSGATLVTVEIDPELATAAERLYSERDDVEVVQGDWLNALSPRGPFDVLFLDGGGSEALSPTNWPLIASLVVPGGILVLDDLTPERLWPESWWGKPDPKRELAFRSGRFRSTELLVRPDVALLLAVRSDGAE